MKTKHGEYPKSDPATLRSIPKACSDEREAVVFLEQLRWNGKPFCPREGCASLDVYAMKDRKTGERERHYRWRCRGCGKQFSVRTNTPMADTNLPLRVWMTALWMQVTSKKGVPALQVARMTGVSYKWALFLCHRIRHAVAETGEAGKLVGVVEADECFIGGKPRLGNFGQRRVVKAKMPVIGVMARGGDVRAFVIPQPTVHVEDTKAFLAENVDMARSHLVTDESALYRVARRSFSRHSMVNHQYFEWARRSKATGFVATTNTIEGFWGLLKKRIGATHHAVSAAHLHRYVAEACFHWNTRQYADADRLRMAVIRGEGKRLLYRRRAA